MKFQLGAGYECIGSGGKGFVGSKIWTSCIMPLSSWSRMWQWRTNVPGKSTNRLRILT